MPTSNENHTTWTPPVEVWEPDSAPVASDPYYPDPYYPDPYAQA